MCQVVCSIFKRVLDKSSSVNHSPTRVQHVMPTTGEIPKVTSKKEKLNNRGILGSDKTRKGHFL